MRIDTRTKVRKWVMGTLTLCLLAFLPLPSGAQSDTRMREVFAQAENDYRIGRIEQARDTLIHDLAGFHGNLRQNALRLIALSYLARFDMEKTQHYAAMMLQENPYYTPNASDPPAFADIVNDIKAGMTNTITTASSQAESLAEVPVPTTLITEQMIHDCGGRNLQEVLAAYVPGMNIIDCNDDININMRGIYSNTQEKMLFMLNGHRLNSYATNTAAPDFSISLEKVKQIEVLRGPASSLYGGVALTAVVNIITKDGRELDGMNVKAGVGNYGQLRGDLVFGKHYFDLDLLLWGSIYHNNGERRGVSEERSNENIYNMPVDHIYIGRIGDKPSYDFGTQLRWKGWQFLYDTHFSQVVSPYTMTTLALSYDHDRYRTYNGIKPSFTTVSHHSDLSYSHQFGNLSLKAALTYDHSDLTRYQVINDQPLQGAGETIGLPEDLSLIFDNYQGLSRYVNGQEQNYGAQLKGNYNYKVGENHKGSIGFGAEFSRFELDDVRFQVGYDFNLSTYENPRLSSAGKGGENSADVYLQLKHQWKSFIVNAGLRYDYKNRRDDTKANELSPRIALILLRPKWNVKLSYSKSFVDAPYVYRMGNVLMTLLRKEEVSEAGIIDPERIHSFQLSFSGTNWIKGLNFEVNGYYNKATNLIMTHVIDYMNAGKNQTAGIELIANYKRPKFTADFNLTWTHTFKSNLMGVALGDVLQELVDFDINTNNNTPAIMSNAVLAWQATKKLKLHSHIMFEGKQTTYNTDLVKMVQISKETNLAFEAYNRGDMQEYQYYTKHVVELAGEIIFKRDMPARILFNVGADYQLGPVTLGLNIHNLFDTSYERSGMNTNVIPQQGRWFMGTVGIRL